MNELITSKEEAREQFDRITNQLQLKHTFSFDEVYDYMMERRLETLRKKDFRQKIEIMEQKFKDHPASTGENPFPLTHNFADGMYIRKITVPADTYTVTKIHAQTHPFFLLKGTISVWSEDGVKTFTAPYSGITKAGTQRIIYHHDEVVFTTVHRTNELDVDRIQDEVTAKDFTQLDDKVTRNNLRELQRLISKQEA